MVNETEAEAQVVYPRKIRLDAACQSELPLRLPQVGDRGLPFLGPVVRAVDAHDVHPRREQVSDETVVPCRFGRHGHHDSDGPSHRDLTQQAAAVLGQEGSGRRWVDGGSGVGGPLVTLPREPVESAKHRLERCEDVPLEPPQRRQPQPRQVRLEAADVLPPQGQVVDQVARAGAVLGRALGDFALKAVLQRDGARAQLVQGSGQPVDGVQRNAGHGNCQDS